MRRGTDIAAIGKPACDVPSMSETSRKSSILLGVHSGGDSVELHRQKRQQQTMDESI